MSITGCLDPKRFKEFMLIRKTQMSNNSARFRFELPTPDSFLGLPVGQHVQCRLVCVTFRQCLCVISPTSTKAY